MIGSQIGSVNQLASHQLIGQAVAGGGLRSGGEQKEKEKKRVTKYKRSQVAATVKRHTVTTAAETAAKRSGNLL